MEERFRFRDKIRGPLCASWENKQAVCTFINKRCASSKRVRCQSSYSTSTAERVPCSHGRGTVWSVKRRQWPGAKLLTRKNFNHSLPQSVNTPASKPRGSDVTNHNRLGSRRLKGCFIRGHGTLASSTEVVLGSPVKTPLFASPSLASIAARFSERERERPEKTALTGRVKGLNKDTRR